MCLLFIDIRFKLFFIKGENGKAVLVNKDSLSESERRKYEIAWQANAFNGYASDMMSLHRTLPDVRDPE